MCFQFNPCVPSTRACTLLGCKDVKKQRTSPSQSLKLGVQEREGRRGKLFAFSF